MCSGCICSNKNTMSNLHASNWLSQQMCVSSRTAQKSTTQSTPVVQIKLMDRNRRQPSPSGRSTAAEGRSSICLTPTVHPSAFVCGVDDFLKIYLWLLLAPIAANSLLALSSQSTAGGFTTLRATSLGLHLPLFSWISTFRLWQTSKSYWLTKFAMGKLIFYDFSQCRHILHLYHKNTIRISLNFFVTDLRSTDLPR